MKIKAFIATDHNGSSFLYIMNKAPERSKTENNMVFVLGDNDDDERFIELVKSKDFGIKMPRWEDEPIEVTLSIKVKKSRLWKRFKTLFNH